MSVSPMSLTWSCDEIGEERGRVLQSQIAADAGQQPLRVVPPLTDRVPARRQSSSARDGAPEIPSKNRRDALSVAIASARSRADISLFWKRERVGHCRVLAELRHARSLARLALLDHRVEVVDRQRGSQQAI